MWEDPANQRGGQLVLRVPKAFTSRCWELILLGEYIYIYLIFMQVGRNLEIFILFFFILMNL